MACDGVASYRRDEDEGWAARAGRDTEWDSDRGARLYSADRGRIVSPGREQRKRQRSSSHLDREEGVDEERNDIGERERALRDREDAVARQERTMRSWSANLRERESKVQEEERRLGYGWGHERDTSESQDRMDRNRRRRSEPDPRPIGQRGIEGPIPGTLCRHALLSLVEFPGHRSCDDKQCKFDHPRHKSEVAESTLRRFLKTVHMNPEESEHIQWAFADRFADLDTAAVGDESTGEEA